eukprot:jgi/Undpi1/4534/HiC_scaffold_18.g07888.m1
MVMAWAVGNISAAVVKVVTKGYGNRLSAGGNVPRSISLRSLASLFGQPVAIAAPSVAALQGLAVAVKGASLSASTSLGASATSGVSVSSASPRSPTLQQQQQQVQPSRQLRVVAEALAAELVWATALANACSPRGVLQALALETVAKDAVGATGIAILVHGGGGNGGEGGGEVDAGESDEKRKEEVGLEAATARVRALISRIRDGAGRSGGDGGDGVLGSSDDRAGGGEGRGGGGGRSPAALHVGESARSARRGERVSTGAKAFRRDFGEIVAEAGGLRALALSWNGVAKLEASFVAWVGEPVKTGMDLRAEILRLASLADALLPSPPRRPSISPPFGLSDSPFATAPGPSPSQSQHSLISRGVISGSDGGFNSGSGATNGGVGDGINGGVGAGAPAAGGGFLAVGSNISSHQQQQQQHGSSLPSPCPETPVGAPLRPRNYVCRDRLSAAAAAALLRGADGSGSGGGGSGGAGGSGGWGGGGGGWKGGAVVAFAGSPGAGKACLAAEVVGRLDVRAKFGEGVLWLQVGRSGGADLAGFLQRLAHAYHKDVWEADVVAAASAAGFDVVVTTAFRDLVPDSALTTRLEVGGLSKEEARSLLRRCSGLDLKATLPPSADGIIKACGALALPLAIAASLPAVRCRSDEAAWANLHAILSHKASRLQESRHHPARAGTGGGGGGGGGGGLAAGGSPLGRSSGTGGGRVAGWGRGGTQVSASGSGSGSGKDSEPPPWVGAVLWASLHALPQGHADQYVALAALPSCLRGAPAAIPSAAGVRGAAGGAGVEHLAALWGIAGVGGTGAGSGGGGADGEGVPDLEEAKATVEMLESRSLLQRRAPPPAFPVVLVPPSPAYGGRYCDTSCVPPPPPRVSATVGGSGAGSGGGSFSPDRPRAMSCVSAEAWQARLGLGAVGPRAQPGGRQEATGDRYAMHVLQAAYVRSVARGRLDLMKTLDQRREAALAVVGPGGLSAALAAATAAAASTVSVAAAAASVAVAAGRGREGGDEAGVAGGVGREGGWGGRRRGGGGR